jgi:selenocysteine lyase/cysteine desulfurase
VIYVSPFEHNSVLRPLEHLRKTVGIRVEVLPFDRQTLECKLEEVKALFRLEPPTMVCVSLVSNVLGLILPVDEICQLAEQAASSAITVVDGAQAAGLLPVEMSCIDALVFSGHKSLYGPYGIAGIAFGRDWRPSPVIRGGTGTQSESIEMPNNGPSRFESGSQNIVAVAGLKASLKWLDETGRDTINEQSHRLLSMFCEEISPNSRIILYLPSDMKMHYGIISFSVDGIMPQAVETALGSYNIAVRAGLHCSPWAHRFINSISYGGTVRVSVGYFNTEQDIDHIRHVIDQVVYA